MTTDSTASAVPKVDKQAEEQALVAEKVLSDINSSETLGAM